MSLKIGEEPIIIVMAGDAKVDNAKYKAQFHTKAKMLTHEEAHTLIGHDVGGVCPFALPENVKVYLDVSLKRFETVFPAAGSDSSAIELTCTPPTLPRGWMCARAGRRKTRTGRSERAEYTPGGGSAAGRA